MVINQDKIIVFLIGVITGIFLTFLFLGGMYAVYKAGKVFAKEALRDEGKIDEAREVKKITQDNSISARDFKIGFEKEDDLEFFEQKDGIYIERSGDFLTDGKYSLLAEFPKGANYPGLFWEVYRKDECLDWGRSRYLSFDVHNNSEVSVSLNLKLKSGYKYPKDVYQAKINLNPQESKNVRIPIKDLSKSLNVREISYINLFINNPQEDIVLYFDNIHAS